MAEIGEYKIRRPQFIIFTDKDGTLNLEDKQLNHIFHLIDTMGGMVIPVTGRTVGDIESDLRKRNIKVPEIIIGDNGSNIYHTRSGEFLVQRVLNHEKVLTIVDDFLKKGGNKDYIRYTNGRNIFASKTKEVKEYYKNSKMAILQEDICEALSKAEDITKITLAGSKEKMEQSAEFVSSLDFWSDRNPTKFPKREYQNYILDVSQKDVNKGEAVRSMVAKLKPRYGYMCIGNGYNDLSMFETAIEDGMIAGVMGQSDPELIAEVKQYSQERKKGKVMVISAEKDLANEYILRMAKLFQSRIKTEDRKRVQGEKRLPNVPRVKVKGIEGIEHRNISSGTGLQKRNRDR